MIMIILHLPRRENKSNLRGSKHASRASLRRSLLPKLLRVAYTYTYMHMYIYLYIYTYTYIYIYISLS